MDHISLVGPTPGNDGWSCEVELLLVRETLVAMMNGAGCASSAMAHP
jgi:hypothetical protein